MARAVEPGSREVERRTWPVGETEHVLIEMHGLVEFPSRYIVMVKHTDAHFHQAPPGSRPGTVSLHISTGEQASVIVSAAINPKRKKRPFRCARAQFALHESDGAGAQT